MFYFLFWVLKANNFESWRMVVIGKGLILSSIYLIEVDESNLDDLVQKLVNII